MNKIFCPVDSKLKIWILLNNGDRITRYSIIKEDRKGLDYSLQAMKRRMVDNEFRGKFGTVIFYDNSTNREILRINSDGTAY